MSLATKGNKMQQEQEWSEVQTEKPEKEKIEFEVEKDEPKKEEIKQHFHRCFERLKIIEKKEIRTLF